MALNRPCHWLSRNRKSKRPGLLLFVDVEANIEHQAERLQDHTFRLGVGCACLYTPGEGLQELEWRTLAAPRMFWEWLEQLSTDHERITIVAHNIDYDARVLRLFWYLPRARWEPTFCVMAPSCTFFVFERDDHKIELLDNMNLWPMPLATLGESIGIHKVDVDFTTCDDDLLLEHCKADVKILVETWSQWLAFLDAHNLGDFGITVGRQAFNAYRHSFMPCKIGIHNNALATSLERDAYRGGRVECFRVGKLPPGRYYKLDANGLYAAMMSWYPYPRKLVKVIQNVSVEYLDHLLDKYLIIAQVALDTKEPKYPYNVSGRNAYPTGNFLTTLTTPELQIARIADEIQGIGYLALYEPADIFSKYIAFLTPLRQKYKQQGLLAKSLMCKLLRNSLQGKFGQKGHKQTVLTSAPIDTVAVRRWVDGETGAQCTDWTFGGKTIRQHNTGEAFDSFPAIPAHVAAYARLYMWSLIEMAGRDHVYYIDTDSLLVDAEGYKRLAGMIDSQRLGYLKLEGEATDVEIYAKKDYRFGDKVTLKGIRETATELSPGVFEQWHFTTLRYAFAAGNLDNVQVHKARKELRRSVVAGTVCTDGTVKPLRLSIDLADLSVYLQNYYQANQWVWEFDEDYLIRLLESQVHAEGVAFRSGPLAPPHSPQPQPLQLVSLAAAA